MPNPLLDPLGTRLATNPLDLLSLLNPLGHPGPQHRARTELPTISRGGSVQDTARRFEELIRNRSEIERRFGGRVPGIDPPPGRPESPSDNEVRRLEEYLRNAIDEEQQAPLVVIGDETFDDPGPVIDSSRARGVPPYNWRRPNIPRVSAPEGLQ